MLYLAWEPVVDLPTRAAVPPLVDTPKRVPRGRLWSRLGIHFVAPLVKQMRNTI